MMLDKQEQARVRHSADGFCRVIGCPECEVRRQERFGGKTLDKVRVEVVEGGSLDIELSDLRREHVLLLAQNRRLTEALETSNADTREMLEAMDALMAQLNEANEANVELTQLVISANERAQALGAEICGFVAAMADLMEAPQVSEEMEEFVSLLAVLALNKLHEAGHRLAPVQPS